MDSVSDNYELVEPTKCTDANAILTTTTLTLDSDDEMMKKEYVREKYPRHSKEAEEQASLLKCIENMEKHIYAPEANVQDCSDGENAMLEGHFTKFLVARPDKRASEIEENNKDLKNFEDCLIIDGEPSDSIIAEKEYTEEMPAGVQNEDITAYAMSLAGVWEAVPSVQYTALEKTDKMESINEDNSPCQLDTKYVVDNVILELFPAAIDTENLTQIICSDDIQDSACSDSLFDIADKSSVPQEEVVDLTKDDEDISDASALIQGKHSYVEQEMPIEKWTNAESLTPYSIDELIGACLLEENSYSFSFPEYNACELTDQESAFFHNTNEENNSIVQHVEPSCMSEETTVITKQSPNHDHITDCGHEETNIFQEDPEIFEIIFGNDVSTNCGSYEILDEQKPFVKEIDIQNHSPIKDVEQCIVNENILPNGFTILPDLEKTEHLYEKTDMFQDNIDVAEMTTENDVRSESHNVIAQQDVSNQCSSNENVQQEIPRFSTTVIPKQSPKHEGNIEHVYEETAIFQGDIHVVQMTTENDASLKSYKEISEQDVSNDSGSNEKTDKFYENMETVEMLTDTHANNETNQMVTDYHANYETSQMVVDNDVYDDTNQISLEETLPIDNNGAPMVHKVAFKNDDEIEVVHQETSEYLGQIEIVDATRQNHGSNETVQEMSPEKHEINSIINEVNNNAPSTAYHGCDEGMRKSIIKNYMSDEIVPDMILNTQDVNYERTTPIHIENVGCETTSNQNGRSQVHSPPKKVNPKDNKRCSIIRKASPSHEKINLVHEENLAYHKRSIVTEKRQHRDINDQNVDTLICDKNVPIVEERGPKCPKVIKSNHDWSCEAVQVESPPRHKTSQSFNNKSSETQVINGKLQKETLCHKCSDIVDQMYSQCCKNYEILNNKICTIEQILNNLGKDCHRRFEQVREQCSQYHESTEVFHEKSSIQESNEKHYEKMYHDDFGRTKLSDRSNEKVDEKMATLNWKMLRYQKSTEFAQGNMQTYDKRDGYDYANKRVDGNKLKYHESNELFHKLKPTYPYHYCHDSDCPDNQIPKHGNKRNIHDKVHKYYETNKMGYRMASKFQRSPGIVIETPQYRETNQMSHLNYRRKVISRQNSSNYRRSKEAVPYRIPSNHRNNEVFHERRHHYSESDNTVREITSKYFERHKRVYENNPQTHRSHMVPKRKEYSEYSNMAYETARQCSESTDRVLGMVPQYYGHNSTIHTNIPSLKYFKSREPYCERNSNNSDKMEMINEMVPQHYRHNAVHTNIPGCSEMVNNNTLKYFQNRGTIIERNPNYSEKREIINEIVPQHDGQNAAQTEMVDNKSLKYRQSRDTLCENDPNYSEKREIINEIVPQHHGQNATQTNIPGSNDMVDNNSLKYRQSRDTLCEKNPNYPEKREIINEIVPQHHGQNAAQAEMVDNNSLKYRQSRDTLCEKNPNYAAQTNIPGSNEMVDNKSLKDLQSRDTSCENNPNYSEKKEIINEMVPQHNQPNAVHTNIPGCSTMIDNSLKCLQGRETNCENNTNYSEKMEIINEMVPQHGGHKAGHTNIPGSSDIEDNNSSKCLQSRDTLCEKNPNYSAKSEIINNSVSNKSDKQTIVEIVPKFNESGIVNKTAPILDKLHISERYDPKVDQKVIEDKLTVDQQVKQMVPQDVFTRPYNNNDIRELSVPTFSKNDEGLIDISNYYSNNRIGQQSVFSNPTIEDIINEKPLFGSSTIDIQAPDESIMYNTIFDELEQIEQTDVNQNVLVNDFEQNNYIPEDSYNKFFYPNEISEDVGQDYLTLGEKSNYEKSNQVVIDLEAIFGELESQVPSANVGNSSGNQGIMNAIDSNNLCEENGDKVQETKKIKRVVENVTNILVRKGNPVTNGNHISANILQSSTTSVQAKPCSEASRSSAAQPTVTLPVTPNQNMNKPGNRNLKMTPKFIITSGDHKRHTKMNTNKQKTTKYPKPTQSNFMNSSAATKVITTHANPSPVTMSYTLYPNINTIPSFNSSTRINQIPPGNQPTATPADVQYPMIHTIPPSSDSPAGFTRVIVPHGNLRNAAMSSLMQYPNNNTIVASNISTPGVTKVIVPQGNLPPMMSSGTPYRKINPVTSISKGSARVARRILPQGIVPATMLSNTQAPKINTNYATCNKSSGTTRVIKPHGILPTAHQYQTINTIVPCSNNSAGVTRIIVTPVSNTPFGTQHPINQANTLVQSGSGVILPPPNPFSMTSTVPLYQTVNSGTTFLPTTGQFGMASSTDQNTLKRKATSDRPPKYQRKLN